jgi:hypothetical protein
LIGHSTPGIEALEQVFRARVPVSSLRTVSRRAVGPAACLLVAFLTAALAPCPPRVETGQSPGHPAPLWSAAGDEAAPGDGQSAEAELVAACPCGCDHAPLAGSSARLGVALPSTAPALAAPGSAAQAAAPVTGRLTLFAIRIDHVPLPAPL